MGRRRLAHAPAWQGDRARPAAAARTLRQPVTENSDVRAAFDGITYAKGEVLLGMFEQWLGADKFRDGVRRYMAKYAWGNATAEDFMSALAASDDAVVPAFRGFVERAGVPLLDVGLDCSRTPTINLAQHRFLPAGRAAGDEKWVFPACFDYGDAKKREQVCTVVHDEKQTLALPAGACPQWVVANRTGLGYYLPRLTPALYSALPKAALPAADYDALLGDLAMLARAGAVSYDVTLAIAARQAASPDPRIARRAADLIDGVPEALIDAPNRPRYAAFVRRQFGDRARALGWLPQGGETLETVRLRETLAPFVAVRGDDTALARKAQQLAQRWLTHRSAIPPSARRMILATAARTQDKDAAKLFDGLYTIAVRSTDPNEREDAHVALGAFRDPALLGRALALTRRCGRRP